MKKERVGAQPGDVRVVLPAGILRPGGTQGQGQPEQHPKQSQKVN